MTAFDAGVYRCSLRTRVLGGTDTIAEFKSHLVVLGKNYCIVETKHKNYNHKSECIMTCRLSCLLHPICLMSQMYISLVTTELYCIVPSFESQAFMRLISWPACISIIIVNTLIA